MVNDHLRSLTLNRRDFLQLPVSAALLGSLSDSAHSSLSPQAGPGSAIEGTPSVERMRVPVTTWRTFESGFHNGPTTHFDQLDPEQYMASVRAAHTGCVVVQAKSCWGYAYYNTKAGSRHPNLNYDLVARMIEAGHRQGLAVVAYYSGQLDTQAALKHSEWMGRNADGALSWWGRLFAWCCHNSAYREYALGMYREIFSQYDFDGLFIDGLPWPRWFSDPLCYCPRCEAQYEKDASENFRQGLDNYQGYRKRLEWLQKSSEDYLDEVHQIVHEARPGLPICFNQSDPFNMSTRVLRKTSYLYMEPLSSPSGLSIGAMVLRDWKMPSPQVGMFWAGYARAPVEVDRFRTAAILLHGVRPHFITDEQNMPDGRQRPQFFEWAGGLQEYVQKTETLLRDLKPVASLGIVFSEATRDHLRAERKLTEPFWVDFTRSIIGCAEILTQTHYPIEILPSLGLSSDSLLRFDLVALPETDALSEAEGQALRDYVAQGGKLLATWKPGLVDESGHKRADFNLADVLGVNYLEEDSKYAGKDGPGIYLQTNGHPLSSFIGSGEVGILGKSSGPPGTFCSFIRVQGAADSILDYRLPYLVPDLDKHLLHSLNPAPPGNEKVPRAATINHYGKGEAVYVGVPLFRRYIERPQLTIFEPELDWVSEWIRGLITRLVPNPAIRVQGSKALHATFFRQGPRRLLIQLANSLVWTSRDVAAAILNSEIVGRSDRYRARSARLLWPREETLTVTKGNEWRVRVPEVALHAIVAIELD
jgi:hypothetical protein